MMILPGLKMVLVSLGFLQMARAVTSMALTVSVDMCKDMVGDDDTIAGKSGH